MFEVDVKNVMEQEEQEEDQEEQDQLGFGVLIYIYIYFTPLNIKLQKLNSLQIQV